MPHRTFHDLPFASLWQPEFLNALDQEFLAYLNDQCPNLRDQLVEYREKSTFSSELLIQCAQYLEQFLVRFFQIEAQANALTQDILSLDPIFAFKKLFVQKLAKRRLRESQAMPSFLALNEQIWPLVQSEVGIDKELSLSSWSKTILGSHQEELLVQWCVQAMCDPEGQAFVKEWVSFALPKRLDFSELVPRTFKSNVWQAPEDHLRQREGFDLTDTRASQKSVQNEINYCIYCHEKEDDFCSKGFPVKKGEAHNEFRENALGNILTGCPLEEKISEMHQLRRDGYPLAALAMIMIDNPMCAATGHRICNDCMKSCIYQKQEPVNIPQTETRTLTDILNLPWGVEIYDLLLRWNPLRSKQWTMEPYNAQKVLVMGMGPAGFTLAYHLLMSGCAVVGVDGLKIEPLPASLLNSPIKAFKDLEEPLSERVIYGFGGVAEYGITARWDKNFLKLIYLCLARQPHFQVFGNVRFGGTLQVGDAWRLGFDHLAIAVGAGLPRELPIPGSMAPGMRQANDFLMTLQLNGAAKQDSLSTLQVSLPAVVIGGGLTGVDAATELQAFYLVQVERVLARYEALMEKGHNIPDDRIETWLQHGRELRELKEKAHVAGETPNVIDLVRSWGGVTIVYRRSMQESPAYRLNHEELAKALEEGIFYIEHQSPKKVLLDEWGNVNGLVTDKTILPAKTILVATGAQPNIAYEYEHRGTFARDNKEYHTYDFDGQLVEAAAHCKSNHFGAFTSYAKADKRVSFLGDTHPLFHGSVVKAIASAKRIYPEILASMKAKTVDHYGQFSEQMAGQFYSTVCSVNPLNSHVIELTVKSPLLAQNLQPGQFCRVQNFAGHSKWMMEPVSAFARVLDTTQGIIMLWVPQTTISGRLVKKLNVGDPIALMGPTGAKTAIPEDKKILVIGDQLGILTTLALGPHWGAAGNWVRLIACLSADTEQLDGLSDCDQVNWICGDDEDKIKQLEGLETFDEVQVVGNKPLVCMVQRLRKQGILNPNARYVASVHGPMQCMLKGVCAQCLQWQVDPQTGQRTKAVYACSWQSQPMDLIDLDHLMERRKQNQTQEEWLALWYESIENK